MEETPLDYGKMLAEAFRDVPRQALRQVAREGLPGEHHFYLTFRTRADGVRVPPFLRDQYPDEMMVVLQRQYWDLQVDDVAFGVTLAFGGQRYHLVVPFAALTSFADPAAQFHLRFEPWADGEGEADADAAEAEDGGEEPATEESARFTDHGASDSAASGDAAPADADGEAPVPAGGGEVVQFDRFRKRDRD